MLAHPAYREASALLTESGNFIDSMRVAAAVEILPILHSHVGAISEAHCADERRNQGIAPCEP
jgi:hypothetical protein